ncbi:MAG: DEAD/DEAH box helicase [Gemmatimonadetes bacterium]|nr:DEAD/DEAH box helicase [Gemmatimonadota bacterium]
MRSGTGGRIIVIAPTRAACETIELAFTLDIQTVLWKHHGERLRALADRLTREGVREGRRPGFGIVAGTGTGKTLSIKPIAQVMLATDDLRVGVINREREATPETPTWNVIIVTTGIARRWFQDGDIRPQDTLVVDEIHQTSAELELCLALGKRVGCRYIWLSATVDPAFYARYLNAAEVIESSAFDPAKAADVEVWRKQPLDFLDDRFLNRVFKERRGVGVFLPTRAGVEQAAALVQSRFPRMNVAFYHGGEPIRVIRPFLEGQEAKPFLLAMTAAGQSALNVQGLDTVIIDDTRFTNIVERGKNVLTRLHLGANEILQMAGRVHGRVAGGRVFILSDRDIQFEALQPTAPEFQLAGDSERVALTCAALGVRADELDLPVPLDKISYRRALEFLQGRGIVDGGKLTPYGVKVEAMPVDRPWAELLVHCDDDLLPYVAVMASIESLHRMTREDRDLSGLIVPGSDHLTSYNVYAEAFTRCGFLGEVYGLPRQLFDESVSTWAERRGVLVKALEDAALAMASIYRAVGLPLPSKMPFVSPEVDRTFRALLAEVMPFDVVIDEQTAWGDEARVSKTSVCGTWGAIAGTLRYFADKWGVPRAAIEGTQLSKDLVRRHATAHAPALIFDGRHKQTPLALERRVTSFGFDLSREREPVREFPPGLEVEARRVLAEAMARGEAHHHAVQGNRQGIEEVREAYRRSGGATPRLGLPELTAWYDRAIAGARSVAEWRAVRAPFDADEFVPRGERDRLKALPGAVELRDRTIAIDYDVEETTAGVLGVARLRMPEKIARTLVAEELPVLDRPLRFQVLRGARGSVKAASLEELQERLDDPFTDDERIEANRRGWKGDRERGGPRDRGAPRRDASGGGRESRGDRPPGGRGSGGKPWKGARGGDSRDAGRHRPGSPSGRGKRRGK